MALRLKLPGGKHGLALLVLLLAGVWVLSAWRDGTFDREVEGDLYRFVKRIHLPYYVTAMDWSPDGTVIATTGILNGGRTDVWSVENGERLHTFKTTARDNGNVAFSGEGNRLLTDFFGHPKPPRPLLGKIWNLETGELERELLGPHEDNIKGSANGFRFSAISADRRFLVGKFSQKVPNQLAVYRLKDFKRVALFGEAAWNSHFTSVAISPDGSRVATGGAFGMAQIYDVATGKKLGQWRAHLGSVDAIAFANGSSDIVTGANNTVSTLHDHWTDEPMDLDDPDPVRVWDAETRTLKASFFIDVNSIDSLAVNPKRGIIAADRVTAVYLLAQDGLKVLQTISYDDDIGRVTRFSPDGRRLAIFRSTYVDFFEVSPDHIP